MPRWSLYTSLVPGTRRGKEREKEGGGEGRRQEWGERIRGGGEEE